MAKVKKTAVESILDKARKNPSPTISDPKQITLFDYLTVRAEFDRAMSELDRVIAQTLSDDGEDV